MALESILVGIVVEEREPVSPWAETAVVPVAALAGAPDAAPWTPLADDGSGRRRVYAGAARLGFHRSETASYRENLGTGEPKLWVVLRPTGRLPGPTGTLPAYDLCFVTADPAEGEAFTQIPGDTVEPVPMPGEVVAALQAFIEAHHVERAFVKRRRGEASEDAPRRGRGGRPTGEDDE